MRILSKCNKLQTAKSNPFSISTMDRWVGQGEIILDYVMKDFGQALGETCLHGKYWSQLMEVVWSCQQSSCRTTGWTTSV